ncbi:MAG: flavohemoglobin expression-modulating QEGLA motif protein [Longimicrobiaceae bacterium]
MSGGRSSGRAEISPRLVAEIRTRLEEGKPVRRTLPAGGRIHIDRPLPFLCCHRRQPGAEDRDSETLVLGEASYLVISAEPDQRAGARSLVNAVADAVHELFGGFLLIELWPAAPGATRPKKNRERKVRAPTFTVIPGTLAPDDPTVEVLVRALRDIPLRPPPLDVEVAAGEPPHPPALPRLLDQEPDRHTLGIEIQPVYRQAKTGVSYPVVVRTARRGLGEALKQTAFQFSLRHTSFRPEHYHALGRRRAVEAAWKADQAIVKICDSFDFLLQVTPVNAERAWRDFQAGGCERAPEFDYRPLVVDVAVLKRRLYSVRTDRLEDSTLAHLIDDTRDELDRKLTMLTDRNTPRFLYGSLQVYGGVKDSLFKLAQGVLDRVGGGGEPENQEDSEDGEEATVDAAGFAQMAKRELGRYRAEDPSLAPLVEVTGEVSGVMVSKGDLLIGEGIRLTPERARALVQHEVGTHVVTHHNGRAQPLRQLAVGLAGYEVLQEGLAVTAEHLAGGLTGARLRTLAGRVVAVRRLIDGADFTETFRELLATYGFGERASFNLCMRVYRSGGLTKDALYLHGLVRLLDHLAAGGETEPLYVGKVAFEHLPYVRELRWRQVLREPPLTPRYLTEALGRERLQRLREGKTVIELLND